MKFRNLSLKKGSKKSQNDDTNFRYQFILPYMNIIHATQYEIKSYLFAYKVC